MRMQVGTSGPLDTGPTTSTHVPGRAHYAFPCYCHPGRWESYFVQLRETLDLAPRNVLEVGVGDGFFGNYLRRLGVDYRSIDLVRDLEPDVAASITQLPVQSASFDVVCAFQVLEHLPWPEVSIALAELARVAKRRAVISLPHAGPYFQFSLKLPLFPPVRAVAKLPWPMRHHADPEHFWEVGQMGFSRRRVRALLKRHFRISKELLVFGFPYHRFYVLEVGERAPEGHRAGREELKLGQM
jgi:SAM-dependent methyltransferase